MWGQSTNLQVFLQMPFGTGKQMARNPRVPSELGTTLRRFPPSEALNQFSLLWSEISSHSRQHWGFLSLMIKHSHAASRSWRSLWGSLHLGAPLTSFHFCFTSAWLTKSDKDWHSKTMIVCESLAATWYWLGFPGQRSELIQLIMFLSPWRYFFYLLSVTLSSLWSPILLYSPQEEPCLSLLGWSLSLLRWYLSGEGHGCTFHHGTIQNPQHGSETEQPRNYRPVFTKDRSIFRAV